MFKYLTGTLAASLLFTSVMAMTAVAGTCGAMKKSNAKPAGDIVDVAASTGRFNTLLAAAKAAGLVDALKGEGPLTLLAPTDDAFAKLPAGTVESLLKPENKDKLKAILLYHVVAGKHVAADVVKMDSARTLEGQSVKISVEDGKVMINNAQVVKADVMASNGVIHVIDTVLLPPSE